MINNFRKIINIFLGVLLLILGVVGLVLPVLNGTIFLIIGFILISFENPYVEKKLFSITQKNATIHKMYLKLDAFLRKFFKK